MIWRVMADDIQEKRTASGVAVYYDARRENAALARALGADVAERFGPRDESLFSLVARDDAGEMIGGVNGAAHWSWFYIRHLWVAPERRGQGLAALLLKAVEAKAKEQGCAGLYIDTFEAGIAGLYERRGFQRAGVIDGFPPGAARYFLFKKL